MRQVIYLLLAANVIYFTWNLVDGSSESRLVRSLPPIPESVRTLVTLREMQEGQQQAADTAEIESITKLKPPGAGPAPGCQVLGPFLAAADLQQVANELVSRGLAPQQYDREEPVEVGFWIFVPPMAWEEAKKITAILDEKGDKDYFIGKENLVALGAFDTMERAKVRFEQVRKYGLDARLEPRYDIRNVGWLELETGKEGGQAVKAALAEFPDIRVRAAACGSIAAENTIQ
jgi:hypothetical protein